MEEIWKDIKGYEGLYQVSNLGRVRSLDRYVRHKKIGSIRLLKGKIMSPTVSSSTGYLVTTLYNKGKGKQVTIHRLVAEAFIPNPIEKTEINHINGIRDDDRVENLEWVNRSENQLHAYKFLKRGYKLPTKEQRQKYIDTLSKEIIQYEVQIIIKEKARYKSIREAERQTGVVHTSISKCCRHKQEKAGGYIWRYENDEIKDKD
jgi:hypothetical protein